MKKPKPRGKFFFTFSNLAISLDGKIATIARGHTPLGTPYDRKLMRRLRLKVDAILMGASSLRAFKKPCLAEGERQSKRGEVASSSHFFQPANIVLSRQFNGISPKWHFFKDKRVRRILFTCRPLPAQKLRAFEATSEVIVLKKGQALARSIIKALQKRGIKKLLVEGGGEVMWEFVRHNLIDEYHVTLTPHLIGGAKAPTLVDGKGFMPPSIVNLKLVKVQRRGQELYLTYRKLLKRGI